MTLASAILGIISAILPIVLNALSKKQKVAPKSYVKEIYTAETERDVETAWAKHDADLERLLS
jgi:hypothetical protein